MKIPIPGWGALGLAAALALAACESAPPPAPPPPAPAPPPPPDPGPPVVHEVPVERCEWPVFDGGVAFIVEAWAVPDETFDVGEPLRLQIRASSPSFINVFHVGTSCKVTRLVRDLRVSEAEIVDFPLPGSGVEIRVKPPAGVEAFYILATRAPADFLAGSDLLGGGDIVGVDLAPDQFYRRLREFHGRIDPNDLSMTTLRTRVVAR